MSPQHGIVVFSVLPLLLYTCVGTDSSELYTQDGPGSMHERVGNQLHGANVKEHRHPGNVAAVEIGNAGLMRKEAPPTSELQTDAYNDCKWNAWTSFSACSVSCGTGQKSKTRTKLRTQFGGGRPCQDPKISEIKLMCEAFPCPIDCSWAEWGAWTACLVSCGGGTQIRQRDYNHTAEHGGVVCPTTTTQETRSCGGQNCPIDCEVHEWSEWGNCTEDCGGGERLRVKAIVIPPQNGGEPCPPMEDNSTCNDDACPIIKAGCRTVSGISIVSSICLLVVIILREFQS